MKARKTNLRKSKPECVAYHEAGHAVAYVRRGLDVVSADMREDGHRLGRATSVDGDWYDRETAEAFVISCLAGYAAEKRFCEVSDDIARAHAASDFESALDILTRLGESQAEEKIKKYVEKACKFVQNSLNSVAIQVIASELLERTHLCGDEINLLIEESDAHESLRRLRFMREKVKNRDTHQKAANRTD